MMIVLTTEQSWWLAMGDAFRQVSLAFAIDYWKAAGPLGRQLLIGYLVEFLDIHNRYYVKEPNGKWYSHNDESLAHRQSRTWEEWADDADVKVKL
jgi:hypothetical protein